MKHIKTIVAVTAVMTMLTGCGNVSDPAPVQKETAETAPKTVSAENTINDGEYIYCVGSVSKVYSTAAVMQLVDKGLVELDTPVTEYIPDFRMADRRYKNITVRMLMNHTSGIMGSTRANGSLYDDNDTYNHNHLLENLAEQRLKAAPGKYAAYCNDGFNLLEMIVENVTGMRCTEYVKENISDKIGVTDTGTPIDMYRNEKLVASFSANGLPLETNYCMTLGTGGIYATASDAAKFGAAFFTGDTALISDHAKSEMATRWNDNEYSDGNGLGCDYAEMLRYQQSGVKVVGKGGDARWMQLYDSTYTIINQFVETYQTGLLPDFIIKDQSGKWVPAPAEFLKDENDGNYYYNSCRTPWRISTDALAGKNADAKKYAETVNAFFVKKTGGYPEQIMAG